MKNIFAFLPSFQNRSWPSSAHSLHQKEYLSLLSRPKLGITYYQFKSRSLPHLTVSASSASSNHSTSHSKSNSLTLESFRHPQDIRATNAVKAVFPFPNLFKKLLQPIEQVLYLENMSSSIKVGESQLPHIYAALKDACFTLDMPLPQLYVRQSPLPNAYTLAIQGSSPFIVIHTSLLDILSPEELKAVLAHELGHLKCEHGLWLTVANLFASALTMSPLWLLAPRPFRKIFTESLKLQMTSWMRAAELTCDRAALVVAGDVKVVVSALMKLSGGSSSINKNLDVDAFIEQALEFEKAASSSRVAMLAKSALNEYQTHPLPVLRVKEIVAWSKSSQFLNLRQDL